MIEATVETSINIQMIRIRELYKPGGEPVACRTKACTGYAYNNSIHCCQCLQEKLAEHMPNDLAKRIAEHLKQEQELFYELLGYLR